MPVSLFISLLILLISSNPLLLTSTPIPTHNRRALHQPFFPLSASPPAAQPPSPSFPKYPSSTNPQPFFPFYPSPPPPPTTSTSSATSSLPTFPANISSIINPNSHSAAHRSVSAKLVAAVLLPLLALSMLSITLAYFFHRRRHLRRHSDGKPPRSDGHRLFPAHSVQSDGRKPPAASGAARSEFLYLGTLVSPDRHADEDPGPPPVVASPYRKLGSPELRPLPPLSRQFRNNVEGGCSSDEEFYSPRGSSAEKESPGGALVGRTASSSRRNFPAVAMEKCGPRSPTLSSPSYSSSNSASSPTPSSPVMSSPPVGSSPGAIKSPDSRSDSAGGGVVGFRPPPPPPPPPPPFRPLTPSPLKRKPPSPSSTHVKDSDGNSRVSEFSGQNLPSPARSGDLSRNPFAAGPPRRHPPPPPPPPPPTGYWESRVRMLPQVSRPPVLVSPPRSIGLKNSTAALCPTELPDSSDPLEKSDETLRPKLKPLHWDKVRASSDRAMVWDQLKSSSFQVNEEMIETLFVCNTTNPTPMETSKRQVLPSNQENRVLDPKKSQNIAILLRALNVTKEEVCEALLEGNTDSLGTELLETLLKMAPSREEELKLKEHKDDSPFKFGPAEKFLKAVLDVPFAFKRVDAMLYIANFDSEVNYLRKSFETLETACEELRSSRLFLKLLEAVLKTGNRMNVGTNRGDAHAFKLDTLLKLVDVKGTDGKTTLLHFVVQEIIKAEGARLSAASPSAPKTQANTLRDELQHKKLGLQAVAALKAELSNVKKAAAMDSDVLSSYVSKLAGGVGKISEVLRLKEAQSSKESGRGFDEAMSRFLKKAEDDIIKVQAQESVALSLVKEITEYFHGNSAKEEAHPFRIFMVVRDFLNILDQVCKEVGKINERSIASSGRQFPVPVNPTLLPVFPRFHALRPGSSDDESSSSSSP